MKFYYKGVGYTCNWKTKMLDSMWYSMLPAKIRVTLSKDILKEILSDVKIDKHNNRLINFKLSKNKGEELVFSDSLKEDFEIWNLSCVLYSSTVSSEYKNGDVTVHLTISVFESNILEKSEVRHILLNEII